MKSEQTSAYFDQRFVGHYITGVGRASKPSNLRPHVKVFGCPMYGTFNVSIHGLVVPSWPITIDNNGKQYRFVVLRRCKGGPEYCGWAIRDASSKQRLSTLEVLTKTLLPEEMKDSEIIVRLPQLWTSQEIQQWAKNQYWFQTFEFTPSQKADSKLVWKTINRIDWSQLKVIDFGCHYGYMSLHASECGASVTGVDKNARSLRAARVIRNHIIQQDVTYATVSFMSLPQCDVILYLSIHHQIDPTYKTLSRTIVRLKEKARKHIFLELILPPTFPQRNTMTEVQIDKVVGGEILLRYKHRVRGYRKVYHIKVSK